MACLQVVILTVLTIYRFVYATKEEFISNGDDNYPRLYNGQQTKFSFPRHYKKRELSKRIIGGELVKNRTLYPYMAIVASTYEYTSDVHFCSGAIIGRYHVLTAAHCICDNVKDVCIPKPPTCFTVHVGKTIFNLGRDVSRNVKKVFLHPNYTSNGVCTNKVDIGIIELSERLPFNNAAGIYSVQLPEFSSPRVHKVYRNEFCEILGYGWTSAYYNSDWGLLKMLKPNFTEVCFSYFGGCQDNHICSEATNSSTPYFVDSGGPLVCNSIVVGVTSSITGSPKEIIKYGVLYSRVDIVVKWIENIMHL